MATAGPRGSVNSCSVVVGVPGGPSMNAAVTGRAKSFDSSRTAVPWIAWSNPMPAL